MSNKRLRILVAVLALFAISSVLLAACTRPGATASTSTGTGGPPNNSATKGPGAGGSGCAGVVNGVPTVHMGLNNFVNSCVTVPKGDKLQFIDDVQVVHILNYGAWNGSNPVPASEPKAPPLSSLMFSGNDTHAIGPFSTAGTYHIYCTVHPGMNLMVTVK